MSWLLALLVIWWSPALALLVILVVTSRHHDRERHRWILDMYHRYYYDQEHRP